MPRYIAVPLIVFVLYRACLATQTRTVPLYKLYFIPSLFWCLYLFRFSRWVWAGDLTSILISFAVLSCMVPFFFFRTSRSSFELNLKQNHIKIPGSWDFLCVALTCVCAGNTYIDYMESTPQDAFIPLIYLKPIIKSGPTSYSLGRITAYVQHIRQQRGRRMA